METSQSNEGLVDHYQIKYKLDCIIIYIKYGRKQRHQLLGAGGLMKSTLLEDVSDTRKTWPTVEAEYNT